MIIQDILDEDVKKQNRHIKSLFYVEHDGPVPTKMTQEELDNLTKEVQAILMNNDNAIPIVCLPPHHKVCSDNTVKVYNMCRKRDYVLERLIKEARHRAYMRAYVLPAVRHYKVVRE